MNKIEQISEIWAKALASRNEEEINAIIEQIDEIFSIDITETTAEEFWEYMDIRNQIIARKIFLIFNQK